MAGLNKNTEAKGTTGAAKDDLQILYYEPAKRLLAENHYRVRNEKVQAEYKDRFPDVRLKTVEDIGGSWEQVMQAHFANGGLLDQLQKR